MGQLNYIKIDLKISEALILERTAQSAHHPPLLIGIEKPAVRAKGINHPDGDYRESGTFLAHA